jgi:hypothetical protein
MKIDNNKGWTEVIIDENCSLDKFFKIAGILQTTLPISFTNKINDTETNYWDFIYKDKELTLHYNIYVGVSIFPKPMTNASSSDNQIVLDLSKTLLEDLDKFNNPNNFVSKYFDPEPIQWGLRGDPQLWRDMKHKTANTNIPMTGNAFEKLLHKLFKELTGEEPQKGKDFYVKKYETVGMSKGFISSDFWIDKGFSILIQRYIESELR